MAVTQTTNKVVNNKVNLFINSESLLRVSTIIYSNLQGATRGKNYT